MGGERRRLARGRGGSGRPAPRAPLDRSRLRRHARPLPRGGDPPAPVNAYGRSKAEAERIVAAARTRGDVVRTSLLYGGVGARPAGASRARGHAFFVDEIRSPVQVGDLAEALLELLPARRARPAAPRRRRRRLALRLRASCSAPTRRAIERRTRRRTARPTSRSTARARPRCSHAAARRPRGARRRRQRSAARCVTQRLSDESSRSSLHGALTRRRPRRSRTRRTAAPAGSRTATRRTAAGTRPGAPRRNALYASIDSQRSTTR